MLAVVREVQIPLLAVLLIGGVRGQGQAGDQRTRQAETGPTAMFPLRLRRPAAIALCATEFVLGVGLLLTAGRAGAGNARGSRSARRRRCCSARRRAHCMSCGRAGPTRAAAASAS